MSTSDKGDLYKRDCSVLTSKVPWVCAVRGLCPQPSGKVVEHGLCHNMSGTAGGLCPYFLSGHVWWPVPCYLGGHGCKGDVLIILLIIETKYQMRAM